jgi:hypothetical protein
MTTTIGQRICAAVIGHQLGIPTDRAMKLYVQGLELDPSWEQVGEGLLKSALARVGGGESVPPASGPQLLRRKSGSERAR